MPLSDATVRQAKPREKPYRLTDGRGLYFEVAPNGSRYWRMKYRFGGKEKRLALGVYPVVTLARARDAALPLAGCCMTGSIRKRKRKSANASRKSRQGELSRASRANGTLS